MKLFFLGTAGGRTVTFKRIRNSGGFLIREKRTLIHVDPGPGAFVYFFNTPYEPWKDLNGVVLSHLHLDHSADVNTILESATESGKRKGVKLLAPKDALEGEKRVVLPYIQSMVKIEILEPQKEFQIGDIGVKVLHRHNHHKVEVYSLEFSSEGKSIVYIPCGKFEEYWLEYLPEGVDLMIFNATFYRKRPKIEHLSVSDVERIILEKKPKKALLTHYSLEMLQKNPLKVAKKLTEKTGVETVAADDMSLIEV
jgi:ribonuclease BN (tRNA processing enzyme)